MWNENLQLYNVEWKLTFIQCNVEWKLTVIQKGIKHTVLQSGMKTYSFTMWNETILFKCKKQNK